MYIYPRSADRYSSGVYGKSLMSHRLLSVRAPPPPLAGAATPATNDPVTRALLLSNKSCYPGHTRIVPPQSPLRTGKVSRHRWRACQLYISTFQYHIAPRIAVCIQSKPSSPLYNQH